MWYWLIPILIIVYIGMVFISGPIYIRLTQDSLRDADFMGYTVSAVCWPVCLPICLIFCAGRSTGGLWVKYAKFLENYYKKTHKQDVINSGVLLMWWYLTPLLVIVYLGMVFVTGPLFVRLTQYEMEEDYEWTTEVVAAYFWPLILPAVLIYCAGRACTVGYAKHLGRYYKKTRQIK